MKSWFLMRTSTFEELASVTRNPLITCLVLFCFCLLFLLNTSSFHKISEVDCRAADGLEGTMLSVGAANQGPVTSPVAMIIVPPGLKTISPSKSHVPFSKSKNNGKSHHWNGLLIVWFQSLTRINLLRPAGLLSLWLITLLFQHWGSWERKRKKRRRGRRYPGQTPTTQMTKPRDQKNPYPVLSRGPELVSRGAFVPC